MKAVRELLTRTYYKRLEQTFSPSANIQSFSVPATATSISVDCVASKGADYSGGGTGGNGGRVQCEMTVTGGNTLYVVVGATPSNSYTGEYNAADIRTDNTGVADNTSLSSRLVVAGAGGSGSLQGSGGNGGSINGQGGSGEQSTGGHGASQTGGGTAVSGYYQHGSSAGTLGLGGTPTTQYAESIGAGGAGYYGGGSGSNYIKTISGPNATTTRRYGGGGGGSSYTDPDACYDVKHTQGYNDGEGYIKISCDYESTSSDYDYYVDTYKYYGTKETNEGVDTYYALKTWAKGQYYDS